MSRADYAPGVRPRRAAPLRRTAVAGLTLLAALLVGDALWIHAKAWLAQRLLERAFHQALLEDRPVRPWPWADTWPVARLEVLALGVSQVVLAGAGGPSLAFGPGWLNGSAAPAAEGLTIVSAHRGTHFAFLGDLRPGHRIGVVRAGDGRRREYVVREREVVDLAAGAPRLAADDGLLLVTCYPLDGVMPGTSRRLLVFAAPVTAPAGSDREPRPVAPAPGPGGRPAAVWQAPYPSPADDAAEDVGPVFVLGIRG